MGNPHDRIRKALEEALSALEEAAEETPPRAARATGEWRVTLEGGATFHLAVEEVEGRWRVTHDKVGISSARTPRAAVLNWAVKVRGWPVAEVLAPGVLSRASLEGAAARAERAWNRLDGVLLKIVGDDERVQDEALRELACSIGLVSTAEGLGRLIRGARERGRGSEQP